MNGAGSLRVCPSTLTWPSAIASSSAAWVFGGVLLISSASSSWVNTGPGRNTISADRWSYSGAPVTSEGSRSGVNWILANSSPSTCANDRAMSVLPKPGTSSSRTWPPARMPISTSSRVRRRPTTARSSSSKMAVHVPAVSTVLITVSPIDR